MRRAASIEKLCEIKDVTEEDAAKIRAIWKAPSWEVLAGLDVGVGAARGIGAFPRVKREAIDAILRTSGVEYLGFTKTGRAVHYCNAGDMYATTVVFVSDRLTVGCIGYYLEGDKLRAPVQF